MKSAFRAISIVFAAGALGGLVNSLCVWLCGAIGLTARFGVQISPPLTLPWLYQRLAWGGLWGFLFLLPLLPGKTWMRAFLFSLAPTAAQFLWVFPLKAGAGYFGLTLGALTPVFVIVFNAIWGFVAAWWIRAAGGAAFRESSPL